MYKSIKILAAAFYMLVLSSSAVAQNRDEDPKDSLAIMRWLSRSFVFDKPDTGFVALEGGTGYRNINIGASIRFITFPGRYAKAKTEFLAEKSAETSLLLDVVYHKLNDQEAFSILREEVSPDKTQYENHISIVTVVGFGDVTVCVVGAYPKSKDALLREKYIQSSLTIREQ